jgi:hypothetical protein
LKSPEDEVVRYLTAVVRKQIQPEPSSLSSLANNVIVTGMLTAAMESARTWKAVRLGGRWPQYRPLNDPDSRGDVDAAGVMALARPRIMVAHLALHPSEVVPIPAGDDALVKDLLQDRFMQGASLPAGESPRSGPAVSGPRALDSGRRAVRDLYRPSVPLRASGRGWHRGP